MPLPDKDDRAFTLRIDESQRPPLRDRLKCGANMNASRNERVMCCTAERIISERREEQALGTKPRECHRCDRTTTRHDRSNRRGLHDLTRARHMRNRDEVDPLDVPDDGNSHQRPNPFSRSDERSTLMLDSDIAALAITGDSCQPVNG